MIRPEIFSCTRTIESCDNESSFTLLREGKNIKESISPSRNCAVNRGTDLGLLSFCDRFAASGNSRMHCY